MKTKSQLRRAYDTQKYQAKKRGIAWGFTFDTWLDTWDASGHLPSRGAGRDQYCMARFNDAGPYTPENVRITTNHDNWRESGEITSARAAFAPLECGGEHGVPTGTQLAVLRFISDHIVALGYPPTAVDIAKFFGWRSANAAYDHIKALERKNLISRKGFRARGITLTKHVEAVLSEVVVAD